jgi:hypothetical protein
MLCNVADMKFFDIKDDCISYQPNVVNHLLQVSHPRMLPLLDSLSRELHKSTSTSLGSAITATQENYVSVRSDIFTSHSHLTFRNRASYIQDGHAPLPSRCCILYIFSINISTGYFKHAAHSPLFPSKCLLFHNATFFGSCIIHILRTECAKI